MKKSPDLDNILEDCLERLLVKGGTVEQCLQSYPEQADELEPLLLTALATKQASAVSPRPEFRARARYQFRSALREAKSERKRPLFSWQPRWATVLIVALALVLAGGGTVLAAGGSMPDSPLYQVKLATEQVRLRLTRSDLGKAQIHAQLADKRVLEIARMAEKGKPDQLERATQRLDTSLSMIVRLVAAEEARTRVLLAPPASKALAPTKEAVDRPVPTVKDMRRAELIAAIARYAQRHPEALRAALQRAPESARPALRRAIAVSVAGYERVLRSLD